VLKFVSAYLALGYLGFATLVIIGLLQSLAAWREIRGLAWLNYEQSPAWRRALGPGIIVVAYGVFFGTWRDLITPGPAGAELMVLFIGSVALALAITLVGAAILHPYHPPTDQAHLPVGVTARPVILEQGQRGLLLFQGDGQTLPPPGPAVCLLTDPSLPASALYPLAGELARRGMVVLRPNWGSDRQRYPDALSLAPLAMNELGRQPFVDADRLALVGVGLGGDLALRAAAGDHQVCAVVALAPLLDEQCACANLGLLCEMTYPQALHWGLGGRRRQLVRQLDALATLGQLAPRPALVLYGSRDPVASQAAVRARLAAAGAHVEVKLVEGEGHLSLPMSPQAAEITATWLLQHLRGASS